MIESSIRTTYNACKNQKDLSGYLSKNGSVLSKESMEEGNQMENEIGNHQTRLLEAKQILEKMANGLHPLTNLPLHDHHFLQDPRVIRPLFLLLNHLNEPKSTSTKAPKKYVITQKQLNAVQFPKDPIGINDFCHSVNEQLGLPQTHNQHL